MPIYNLKIDRATSTGSWSRETGEREISLMNQTLDEHLKSEGRQAEILRSRVGPFLSLHVFV